MPSWKEVLVQTELMKFYPALLSTAPRPCSCANSWHSNFAQQIQLEKSLATYKAAEAADDQFMSILVLHYVFSSKTRK